MATYIFIILLLTVFSAYFSATETALLSANRNRLKTMADRGDHKAEAVLATLNRYDQAISTILVGNNLVNIAASAIATLMFTDIIDNNDLAATVSTGVVTVLLLFAGEITPKTLAKRSPEKFASFSVPILRVLCVILTPINLVFSGWQKLLGRLAGTQNEDRVTEEELITIVEEAENDGTINEQESELIRSAIEFNDREAGEIVTPRVDVVAVERDVSVEELERIFEESGYSRLPVYEGSIDNIVGVIHQKDFFNVLRHGDGRVASCIKPALFATPTMKISLLLRQLQKTKSHIAILTDEYGGTLGIVTMEDILEELVGEIFDEHDEAVEEVVEKDDGSYTILCSAGIDVLTETFDLREELIDSDSVTVGGWVTEQLGKIPAIGDHFDFNGLSVTVTKADNRRVLEISVSRIPEPAEQEEEEPVEQ